MLCSNCVFLLREGQGLVLGKESSELSGGGACVAASWNVVGMECGARAGDKGRGGEGKYNL